MTLLCGMGMTILSCALTLISLPTQAANWIWDGGGDNNNWSTAANWNEDQGAPGESDRLFFEGSQGWNNNNDLAALTEFTGITFNTGSHSFSLSGNAIALGGGITNNDHSTQTIKLDLALTGTRTFVAADRGDLRIDGTISGNFGVNISSPGSGSVIFGAANDYAGDTTITGGTLSLENAAAIPFGTGKGNVIVNGTLGLNDLDISLNGLSGSGTVEKNSGNHTARVLTLGYNGADGNFSGVIADPRGQLDLIKVGSGTQILSGVNTYSGTTTLNDGVLRLDGANALPNGNLVINGGVLGLGAGNFTRALGTGEDTVQWVSSSGGGFAAYGGVRNVNLGGNASSITWNNGSFVPSGSDFILGAGDADGTVVFENPIALNGALRTVQVRDGSAPTDATLSGILSGNGNSGLVKTGAGTLSLTGVNTYSGLTWIGDGVLSVANLGNGGNPSAIGSSASDSGNLVLDGGTLQFTGSATTSDRLFSMGIGGGTIEASGTGALNLNNPGALGFNSQSGSRVLHLSGSNGDNNTLSAIIGDNGGPTTVIKDGNGTWILSGNNTFTGGVTINAGVLQLGSPGSLNAVAPNVVSMTGGTLRLNGLSTTVSGLSGTGMVENNHATAVATLTVSKASGSDTFSGVIRDGSTARLSLTKTGAGTLVLSGANTYTGGTTLSGGVLRLGANNVLADTGAIQFNGGQLNAGDRTEVFGALSLSANSTLNLSPDGAAGRLTFASASWTAGVLTITGWSGTEGGGTDDRIFITGGAATSDFLANVRFDGWTKGATLNFANELVPSAAPVPEPINAALGLFAAIFVSVMIGRGWLARRKRPLNN